MENIAWKLTSFEDLTNIELYEILHLRNLVFVQEQNCVYVDTDGLDNRSLHYTGYLNNELVAYVRLLPPGLSFKNASIGRVLTKKSVRRKGFGKMLMQKAIALCLQTFLVNEIDISAQLYLKKFYTQLGFTCCGAQYLEDNIPHIKMTYKQ